MAGQHECAGSARFLAGILGERGLPDAGLAAEDDEATLPGERRAELRAEEASFARAPDQEWRSAAGKRWSASHDISVRDAQDQRSQESTVDSDMAPLGAVESAESIAGMIGFPNPDPRAAAVQQLRKDRSVIAVFSVSWFDLALLAIPGVGDTLPRNPARLTV